MTSLKAGCCECLLCDFALLLPQASFVGERLKGEELLEDNSMFAGGIDIGRDNGLLPSVPSD